MACGDTICKFCSGYNGNHADWCPWTDLINAVRFDLQYASSHYIQWCSWCGMPGGKHRIDCPCDPVKAKWEMTVSSTSDEITYIKGEDMSCQCPYCQTNSLGEHESNCPFHPDNTKNVQCRAQFGWQCPKCGTIYSPMITQCDCAKYEKYTVTNISTGA